MIPKHFYQVCETQLTENEIYWAETFDACNPTYGHSVLTEADFRAVIAGAFAWFLPHYETMAMQDRLDIARYFLMFQQGGIFLSRDVECLSPLDQITNVGGVVLGRMGTLDNQESIPNSILFSEPREEFWLLCISIAMDNPWGLKGHAVLHKAANLYHAEYPEDLVQNRITRVRTRLGPDQRDTRKKSNVNALPGVQFFPINRNDALHERYVRYELLNDGKRLDRETAVKLFPRSFTVSYWTE